MAPSVKPAARLSERPFFLAVGIRRAASRVRVDSSAGDEWSREAPISRVPPGVVRSRGGGCDSRGCSSTEALLSAVPVESSRLPPSLVASVVCATTELDLRSGEATRRT